MTRRWRFMSSGKARASPAHRFEREDQPLLLDGQLDVGGREVRLSAIQRELGAEVAVEHVAGDPVDRDAGHQADLRDQPREGRPLAARVASPVVPVGHELGRGDLAVADDPVAPRDRARAAAGVRIGGLAGRGGATVVAGCSCRRTERRAGAELCRAGAGRVRSGVPSQ